MTVARSTVNVARSTVNVARSTVNVARSTVTVARSTVNVALDSQQYLFSLHIHQYLPQYGVTIASDDNLASQS